MSELRTPYTTARTEQPPDYAAAVAGMEMWECKAALVLAYEELDTARRNLRIAWLVITLLEGEKHE